MKKNKMNLHKPPQVKQTLPHLTAWLQLHGGFLTQKFMPGLEKHMSTWMANQALFPKMSTFWYSSKSVASAPVQVSICLSPTLLQPWQPEGAF